MLNRFAKNYNNDKQHIPKAKSRMSIRILNNQILVHYRSYRRTFLRTSAKSSIKANRKTQNYYNIHVWCRIIAHGGEYRIDTYSMQFQWVNSPEQSRLLSDGVWWDVHNYSLCLQHTYVKTKQTNARKALGNEQWYMHLIRDMFVQCLHLKVVTL